MEVPERLAARLASEPDAGRGWLAALPGTVERLCATWSLTLDDPIEPGGVTSIVFPARRGGPEGSAPDGRVHSDDTSTGSTCERSTSAGQGPAMGFTAVVKIPVPDVEVAPEAAGLALVDGDGAVRLSAYDRESGSMLLEAADPHRSLLDLADAEEATRIAADLLRRWWRSVPTPAEAPIPRLTDVGPDLAAELRRRRPWLAQEIDSVLIDRAVSTLADPDPAADTLLHTDLHQGNVLRAAREPWLIIDPKPLVGERAYDLEPLLRDHRGDVPGQEAIRRRFDTTSAQLGLDRDRARDWVIARSVLLGSGSLQVRDGFGSRQLRVAEALALRQGPSSRQGPSG